MSSDLTSPSNQPKRIGELLTESGMLCTEDLKKGLDYGKKTGLPLGRVLVMLRLVSDSDLRAVLQVQSLQKFEGLPSTLAIKSLSMARERGISIDEALKQVGWSSDKFKAGMPPKLRELKDKLADAEARLGPEHAEVAGLLLELAEFYEEEEMWPHAEANCEQAVSKLEKAVGHKDLRVGQAVRQLGNLLFHQDRFEEAQAHYQRVLQIKQDVLGGDHPDVYGALHDLAEVFDIQKKYAEAEEYYLRCVRALENAGDTDNPQFLQVLKRLSYICAKRRGRAPDQVLVGELLTQAGLVAQDKLPQALAYSKEQGVPLARALVLMNLLSDETLRTVLHAQLLIKSALLPAVLAPHALRICTAQNVPIEEALKVVGWTVAGKSYELSELLHTHDQLLQAEKELLPEDPQIATLCMRLGDLYETYERYGEAEPLYKRALGIIEKTEPDGARVLELLDRLGGVHVKQQKYEPADAIYKRVLELRMERLGAEHADVGTSYLNLGRLNLARGDHGEAVTYLGRALKIVERQFGSGHAQVADIVEQMALTFYEMGDHDRAEPLFWQAYKIKREYLDINSHEIVSLLTKLAEMYNKDGKYSMADSVLVLFQQNKSVFI